jgi:hypothetical protein
MQNKGKLLKNRGVTYQDARFGPVSYLDMGTLQNTGRLLGGGFTTTQIFYFCQINAHYKEDFTVSQVGMTTM